MKIKMVETRCIQCGRPLKNPVSIALGMGSICRGKTELRDMRRIPFFLRHDRRRRSYSYPALQGTEGLVRAYDVGEGLYCLGYWVEPEDEGESSVSERIWAAYWDGEKLEKRNLVGKTVLVCEVDNLPAAQFIATQILPLKA